MPLYGENDYGFCRYGLSSGCLPDDWFRIAYDSTETDILSLAEFDADLNYDELGYDAGLYDKYVPYCFAGSSPTGKIYRTLNGTTWTLAYDTPELRINDLVPFGSYLYAATGGNGLIYKTTAAGTTWTLAYDSPLTDIKTMRIFGSYLYAAGDGGIIYRSSDGSTWTLAYDSPADMVYDLEVFGSYLYAATGDTDGIIYRTNDGTTWTIAYDTPQNAIWSLAAMGSDYPDGSAHILAGADTGFLIYKSTDGTTWEVGYDGPDTIGGVKSLYGTNAMVYAGSDLGGVLYRSDNTLDWSISYDSPAVNLHCMINYSLNCKMYLGTGDNAIIYSMDNLVQKDLIPDVVYPDGFEVLTSDTITVQWSMNSTSYTNIVWDLEYTRDWSTSRTWFACVDSSAVPLTGISTSDKVTVSGEYLTAAWNILPIMDSADMKIRIRARDTSVGGCAGNSSWNESSSTFEINNGPC